MRMPRERRELVESFICREKKSIRRGGSLRRERLSCREHPRVVLSVISCHGTIASWHEMVQPCSAGLN